MADKFHSDTHEKIETISYKPNLITDTWTGSKTITATAEASGIGNADISFTKTFSRPNSRSMLSAQLTARSMPVSTWMFRMPVIACLT